jgi:hypothetical protein
MSDVSPEAYQTIKQQFRDIGCRVKDFSETHFEIVHDQFPAATLINPTGYYLEYATILWARPGGFLQRGRSLRDGLLNEANLKTHVAKLTCDAPKIDGNAGGWQLQATARMVTGTVTEEYQTETIKNWTNLWLQDIANIVLIEGSFEIVAIMKKNEE